MVVGDSNEEGLWLWKVFSCTAIWKSGLKVDEFGRLEISKSPTYILVAMAIQEHDYQWSSQSQRDAVILRSGIPPRCLVPTFADAVGGIPQMGQSHTNDISQ